MARTHTRETVTGSHDDTEDVLQAMAIFLHPESWVDLSSRSMVHRVLEVSSFVSGCMLFRGCAKG